MSKRRQRSPKPVTKTTRASTPSPQPQPDLARLDLPIAPDQRPTPPLTTTPKIRHRLATSANGSGGNGGNSPDAVELLGRAAALLDLPAVVSDQPSVLRARVREYAVRTARAVELEKAAAELRNAEHAAGVVRRRIEREQRSAATKRNEKRVATRAGCMPARRALRTGPCTCRSTPTRGRHSRPTASAADKRSVAWSPASSTPPLTPLASVNGPVNRSVNGGQRSPSNASPGCSSTTPHGSRSAQPPPQKGSARHAPSV